MQQTIQNPEFHTLILILIFLLGMAISSRKRQDRQFFPTSVTQELKGFAILTIIFGHIGYFLDTNDTFLFPLSVASGVGVNIFLFLSGFGLTMSTLKKQLSLLQFYKRRLLRLFLPMWIVLTSFLLLDYTLFNKMYPQKETLLNFFGFFPNADIYSSVNSVLWYFSLILFLYIIYPILSRTKILLLSPILIYFCSYFFLNQKLPINPDVINLYKLHLFAFPAGVFFALLPTVLIKIPILKNSYQQMLQKVQNLPIVLNVLLLIIFASIFSYTAIYSKVGDDKLLEQIVSDITMFSAVVFFLLKRFSTKILTIFGSLSYEIYLIHWPIAYRYDFLYSSLPASLATLLYLSLIIGLAYLLQIITEKIAKALRM